MSFHGAVTVDKEMSLDEKRSVCSCDNPNLFYPEEAVKKSIKELKEWKWNGESFTNQRTGAVVSGGWFYKIIDRIFGKGLI